MSASPSSASRLGTKLEIHDGVATSQSNAEAWPAAIAKSIGWTIYAAGVVIWLFGYLSALPLRPLAGLAQIQEPGSASGAPRGGRGLEPIAAREG